MKVSTKGRYAIRALTHLAKAYNEKKCVTIKELSEKEKTAGRYLENIFVKLRKAGIVNSLKGEKGGFFLTENPEKIDMYDILKAVENILEPSECLINPGFCGRVKSCGMRKIWERLSRHIDKFLKKITLKYLADNYFKGQQK
ncbi:MAG: Rrf2 family transcriptional regulator [Candidatus Goldbacteria bacterium]|nr:Rrf2 family transcriptional regulator [Candidatus Goldiibacteriota bacterium]